MSTRATIDIRLPEMPIARSARALGDDERRQVAELAFELGGRYADRSLHDIEAGNAQWAELRETGLTALSMPAEHGGAGDIGDLCVLVERLAAGGYPQGRLTLSTAVVGTVIARHASPAQRERWLPGIADGSLRCCFALTEPTAGSNANNLTTRARRVDGAWRISGQKTYISAADDSELMLLVAKDAETGGLSLFGIELPCQAMELQRVGVTVNVPENQWSVFFDDVRVEDDGLIGEPGRAGRALFDALNPERLIVAAHAVGVGRWCLAKAVEYAGERVVFGVPIGQHQAVQHPLAEAFMELESAWALVERAAYAYEAGWDAGVACNLAKLKACDAGLKAADCALQTFGGSGFTDETMMYDRYGFLRLLRTVPVARELALNHVATAGLGLPRSY